VHGAQDSHLLSCHMNFPKYSKLFIQIVRETSVGKVIVRKTSCKGNNRRVRARRRPGSVFPGNVLSGKRPLPEDIARQICVMVPRWRIFGDYLDSAFPASCVQHISHLHSKFALRPHHVWKYGRHPICDR